MSLRNLPWRIGLTFAAFVLAGSIVLLLLITRQVTEENRAQLLRLAQTNAEFLARSRLPTSPNLAASLEQVLGMTVVFRGEDGVVRAGDAALDRDVLGVASDGAVHRVDSVEVVAMPIDDRTDLVLARPYRTSWSEVWRAPTFTVLAAFWVFAVLLGWFATRRLMRAEKMTVLGNMTAALAHEVQNPVASIKLDAQLLAKSDASTPARRIEREADRIDDLLSQWLFLTRPDSPATSRIDVGDLLAEVVAAHEAQAEHAGVRVVVDAEDGIAILGDRKRLTQVLRNVLVNAIHAMPTGGDVEISGRTFGTQVRIEVRDRGRGFSREALQRGSEFFFSEKEGGMGIGLSVASEVTKAHGGALELGNREGGGASVTICLPTAPENP